MYQMMLNRKNSRKGFTLVEVIVVLVILAILAAIMIPAMTGWIDEAKTKAVYVEARSALLAAQTLASESYGKGGDVDAMKASASDANIKKLARELKGTASVTAISADGQVTGMTYSKVGSPLLTYALDSDTGVGAWTEGAKVTAPQT